MEETIHQLAHRLAEACPWQEKQLLKLSYAGKVDVERLARKQLTQRQLTQLAQLKIDIKSPYRLEGLIWYTNDLLGLHNSIQYNMEQELTNQIRLNLAVERLSSYLEHRHHLAKILFEFRAPHTLEETIQRIHRVEEGLGTILLPENFLLRVRDPRTLIQAIRPLGRYYIFRWFTHHLTSEF